MREADHWISRILLPLIALGLVLPGGAMGEGSVRRLDCTVQRVCDAGGRCESGTGEIRFRMEPEKLDPAGAGSYTLSYGEIRAPMTALSDAGPFFWTVGVERDTLLASSETEFLWHRLEPGASPVTTIRFLSCTFHW